jgi:hypothetical protein
MALVAVTFVAMSGGKSTSLPTLLGGLVLATAVTSIAARKINLRAVALTATAAVAFEVAKVLFFGPGSHGLVVDPFALSNAQATAFPGLAGPDGSETLTVRAIVATIVLAHLTLGAGALALLGRRGWAKPDHVFLLGTCLTGLTAGLAFHQSSYSEYYFVFVVALPFALAAALGVHHVAADWPRRTVVSLGLSALAIGALGAALVWAFVPRTPPKLPHGSPVAQAVHFFAMPALGWVALGLVLAALVLLGRRVLARRPPAPAGAVLMVTAVVFAGLGMGPLEITQASAFAKDPLPRPVAATTAPLIGGAGIRAARWLRAHSRTDALVATNAHCQIASEHACIPRNFWMAGYSERQFLVEGWSYVSRASIGQHPPADEDTTVGPFWDPKRLAANDVAFTHPTAARLAYLAQHYGVQWLFVDTAAPVDLAGLTANADLRFSHGRYRIFRLR